MRNDTMRRIRRMVAGAALVALGAACDTSVTNPGPTPNEFLNRPDAFQAIVLGAQRALSDALNTDPGAFTLYWSAAVTFEINPAGSTGSFGIEPEVQNGIVDANAADDAWGDANQARFVAEDAIRRFTTIGASNALLAEVTLYAGYANRLLGETFCGAVIPIENADGTLSPGDSTAFTDYFVRAEGHFTTAMQLATTAGRPTLATAAQAGRASARASLATYGLANWSDAASDAAAVTDNAFVFQAPYHDQDQGQFNALVWANGNSPYRAHTQWGTFAEAYQFANPLDTRIAWDSTALLGDAAVGKFGGRVPWFPQRKYPAVDSPVNLSSGWEMRLIEAEATLASGGSVQTTVNFINQRRTNLGLPLYATTVSADSAWSLLKLERQIELWLENRRMGDLRRWADDNTPGATQDGLYVDNDSDGINETRTETMFSPIARSLCFPIGDDEKDTNPNLQP